MSESAPEQRLCPHFSTAQVLVGEVMFQAQVQKGMNLASLQLGAHSASAPDVTSGKAVFIHRDPILPDGMDPNKPIDIAQIKRFKAQPISVPCVREQCQIWDDKLEDCGYKHSRGILDLLAAMKDLMAVKSEAAPSKD